MIAGPPYAVAPILKKVAMISRIELHLRAAARARRPFVQGDRRRAVLKRGARAVEDGDFVVARTARPPPGDDVAELGMDLLARQESRRERVLQLADLRALYREA